MQKKQEEKERNKNFKNICQSEAGFDCPEGRQEFSKEAQEIVSDEEETEEEAFRDE